MKVARGLAYADVPLRGVSAGGRGCMGVRLSESVERCGLGAGRSPCDEVAPPTQSVGALPAAAGLRPVLPLVAQRTEVRRQRSDFYLLPSAFIRVR